MQNTIFITVREIYGIPSMYPACDTSRKLCQLTGRKTITPADLSTIKSLGYCVCEAPSAAGRKLGLAA